MNLSGFKISDYEYSLGFFPLITLWNPYNRDLVLPQKGIGVEVSPDATTKTAGK